MIKKIHIFILEGSFYLVICHKVNSIDKRKTLNVPLNGASSMTFKPKKKSSKLRNH